MPYLYVLKIGNSSIQPEVVYPLGVGKRPLLKPQKAVSFEVYIRQH